VTFFQALRYFAQEALVNLVRSWKVSLVAVLTIGVSLFLAGVFLLTSGNLRSQIEAWYDESKIVVYLENGATEAEQEKVAEVVRSASWVQGVEVVDSATARKRFEQAFPSMADLLDGWNEDPLPVSMEVRLDWRRLGEGDWDEWLHRLRAQPSVLMVDDDRDWLDQLEAVLLVLEGLGLLIGGILLFTAIFTIASVIRLTAYLYRDEIAVMRLVGATEFFIRGPFYVEGLFQGLLGGGAACSALFAAYLAARRSSDSLLATVLLTDFLPPVQIALLMGLGAAAGLIGAVTSLRREDLAEVAAEETAEPIEA
jgi:cell division transport system permease protein